MKYTQEQLAAENRLYLEKNLELVRQADRYKEAVEALQKENGKLGNQLGKDREQWRKNAIDQSGKIHEWKKLYFELYDICEKICDDQSYVACLNIILDSHDSCGKIDTKQRKSKPAETRQMDFADALRDTDYFTHHNDWFSACKIAYINADNEADSSYWMHQLNTLSALEAEYGNPVGVKNK